MSAKDIVLSAAGAATPAYIDDIFSTYVYNGNGGSQTISNGIDLATYGGLVWVKARLDQNGASTDYSHQLFDTARGADNFLSTDTTNGTNNYGASTSFTSTGFSMNNNRYELNRSGGEKYVSWTFRKKAKFFDIVTYTGDGTTGRSISHSLGSTPGFIMIKKTSGVSNWIAYHRSLSAGDVIYPSSTSSAGYNDAFGTPNSSTFVVQNNSLTNGGGQTYVAYLFAHNAGGFGAAGTDDVISCGSFTTNGSGQATINLGWEPQWVLQKRIDNTSNWAICDSLRGMTADGSAQLFPDLSDAENTSSQGLVKLNSTGFVADRFSNATYIYIAIRRPMKPPTTGTEVFSVSYSSTSNPTTYTNGFAADTVLSKENQYSVASDWYWFDRIRPCNYSSQGSLSPTGTDNEQYNWSYGFDFGYSMTQMRERLYQYLGPSTNVTYFNLKRAPKFYDIVTWNGNSNSSKTITHNLGVAPELIISRARTSSTSNAKRWFVYAQPIGITKRLLLHTDGAAVTDNAYNDSVPTSTSFQVYNDLTNATDPYVGYMFATLAGISKVGSYTGTGSTQQINCGFSGGARFIMIKRYDTTGNWYFWNSTRGISSGNDPYFTIPGTPPSGNEVTNTDYIDPYSAGFEISSTAPADINANGGTYIYLAIA